MLVFAMVAIETSQRREGGKVSRTVRECQEIPSFICRAYHLYGVISPHEDAYVTPQSGRSLMLRNAMHVDGGCRFPSNSRDGSILCRMPGTLFLNGKGYLAREIPTKYFCIKERLLSVRNSGW